MFKYNNKKNILSIFLLATSFLIANSPCYAAYDVVKAKTIRTDVKTSSNDIYFNSFIEEDDFSIDSYSTSEETPFDKKIKNIFKRKNKKNEQIEEENVEEDIVETEQLEDKKSDNEEEITQENKDENLEQNSIEEVVESEPKQEENVSQLKADEFVSQNVKLYRQVEVDEKFKFKINADKMTYDDTQGNVYASGNVEIIAKEEKVVIKADEMVLDKEAQLLKLNGNVKVIKEATEMQGESLVIDLNEQNILMDAPTLYAYSFAVTAQEGHLVANNIEMLNGSVTSVRNKDFPLVTKGFLGFDAVSRNNYFGKSQYQLPEDGKEKRQTYRIDAKEVVITCFKDHNSVLLKDSDIFYNGHKIINGLDFEIIRDKQNQVSETNAPEAGNLRNFGFYAGYGKVFKLPQGQTLKLMPVLAYHKSDFGLGILGRYNTPKGRLDGGWNMASENLVVRGRYDFNNNLKFNYGRHAYMPEGFMGARRSGYAAQLHYQKSYRIKDLGATFSNGFYAGLFSDYSKKDQEDAFSTTRFRYMAQLRKNFYQYKNEEQDFGVVLGGTLQGAATVYGTGHDHGIIRIGSTLSTRFRRWDSTVGYFLTGLHGDTPFRFDRYRYGKSTITLNERFNVNDKFAFGFRLFITPMKDNYKEDLLTEARIYIVAGPSDLKFALSYDFVRDIAHMNFMFLIGSENAKINFDKLSTKDIDGGAQKRDFYKNAKPIKINAPEEI